MRSAAERMRVMRGNRRAQHRRDIRLSLPDPRSPVVRERIARQIATLNETDEAEALRWIESVSEFDNDAAG